MGKIQVFWGVGKIGKAILEWWHKINIKPDFLCDSSKELWGQEINGIRILSPEQVYQLKGEALVFITCAKYQEIKKLLLEHGMSETDIVIADYAYAPAEMVYRLSDKLFQYFSVYDVVGDKSCDCLIDLSQGMVLGGVERWSYSLEDNFKQLGIRSAYMMPEDAERTMTDDHLTHMLVKEKAGVPILDTIWHILNSGADTIICNFPFTVMIAACLVKKYKNPKLRTIAVVHNDEDIYYRTLMLWEKYIDICLTISDKIKHSLLERNFPSSKLKDLYWRVPCSNVMDRSYSAEGMPLRIGYAGRISVRQKRVDLLLEVAERLKESHVNFCMNIAGSGEYEEELKEQIKVKQLSSNINLPGVVRHEDIMEFWKEQDICISCSEWEGHSISHSEAMAAGVVLVITDTSGARDDVEHGINGFVVEVGDVEMLIKHIVWLDNNKERLQEMGACSIEKIMQRNEYMEPESYWKSLLGKN